jgi:hypothetical protein
VAALTSAPNFRATAADILCLISAKEPPMTIPRPLLPALSLTFVLLSPGACTPARMAVPKDIGVSSDEIAISERSGMSGALANESFKMGQYQVVDVSRKWNSGTTFAAGGFSSGSTTGGYTFGLKAPNAAYNGKCASQLEEKSMGLLGGTFGKQKTNVLCECTGPAPVSLSLRADTTSHYQGTLSARNANFTVEGVYQDETGGSRSSPLGYQVRSAETVGAVEVAGKGRVWLSKGLDDDTRVQLACVFAGLLLYQPPEAQINK